MALNGEQRSETSMVNDPSDVLASDAETPQNPILSQAVNTETAFEKKRGISGVEIKPGFTQVHISRLESDVIEERLRVLAAVADAQVSIDFLKLTPSGMSFLIQAASTDRLEIALKASNVSFSTKTDRAIVLVNAVNIRDEEGRIAGLLSKAIESRFNIDHASDMHDRVLVVMEQGAASEFASSLLKEVDL